MARVTDPVAPREPVKNLRAKELKNTPCLIRPGQYYEKQGEDGKPWKYVECEVATLDRQGVVEQAGNVRISWVRALPQLQAAKGTWIACRPYDTGEGIVLQALEGDAREVAERVLDELASPN